MSYTLNVVFVGNVGDTPVIKTCYSGKPGEINE